MTEKTQIPNNRTQDHLLVIRFSSMGDVAIMVPVINQLRKNYPLLFITVVSQEKFKPLFENIEGVDFFSADIFGVHHGIAGVFRLFRELRKKQKISFVADLHNVIRSKALIFLFRLYGYKTGIIHKERNEKKKLIRKENKNLKQLKTTVQRYADVFTNAGFPVIISNKPERKKIPLNDRVQKLMKGEPTIKLGIAPFAKHREKMYPLEALEQVIMALPEKKYEIFLFGGGKIESELMY
jgi:ADP-heptose:LPS heptosyltransferase